MSASTIAWISLIVTLLTGVAALFAIYSFSTGNQSWPRPAAGATPGQPTMHAGPKSA